MHLAVVEEAGESAAEGDIAPDDKNALVKQRIAKGLLLWELEKMFNNY